MISNRTKLIETAGMVFVNKKDKIPNKSNVHLKNIQSFVGTQMINIRLIEEE